MINRNFLAVFSFIGIAPVLKFEARNPKFETMLQIKINDPTGRLNPLGWNVFFDCLASGHNAMVSIELLGLASDKAVAAGCQGLINIDF